MGIREDFAYGVDDDSDILFLAMDSLGISYNKIELEEGTFPSGEERYCAARQIAGRIWSGGRTVEMRLLFLSSW